MGKSSTAKLKLSASMGIFGTIGVFVRYIPLPSSVIALVRGLIGMLFLLLVMAVTKKSINVQSIRKNLLILILSGIMLGANWILLFEAYHYTTVATATLCYYLAPVIIILVSPLFLRERLSLRKLVCVIVALGGMVCVSGVLETGIPSMAELKGILFGLGAAFIYASIILLNKKLKDISAYDKTVMQLGISAVVLLPYTLFTQTVDMATISPRVFGLLLILAVVHTGIAYALYFGSMRDLRAQTVAIFSYIDPVVAILLSALFLQESIGVYGILGAIMILGATFVSEYKA